MIDGIVIEMTTEQLRAYLEPLIVDMKDQKAKLEAQGVALTTVAVTYASLISFWQMILHYLVPNETYRIEAKYFRDLVFPGLAKRGER